MTARLSRNRVLLIGFGIAGVVLTFLLQNQLTLNGMTEEVDFVLRKSVRVILNDVFMLLVIVGLFYDRKVTRLAIAIQLVDALVLLPLYFFFKLSLEGTSEISAPLLSQFHRLIVNPTLLLLLIPAVYFQRAFQPAG